MCEDQDGTVWVGLLTGLARLKDNQIRNISHANGLFDDFIFALIPDDRGSFWVNSKRGIFRVSRQNLDDFCDGKTNQVQCDAYDGGVMMKTVITTDQEWNGCKTKDGRIWFPSSQGAVMIDPTNLHVNPTPPLVYLRQLRANGNELKAGPGRRRPARPGRSGISICRHKFGGAGAGAVPVSVGRLRPRLGGGGHEPVRRLCESEAGGIQIPGERLQCRRRLERHRGFRRRGAAAELVSNRLVLSGLRGPGGPGGHENSRLRMGLLRRRQRELETARELLETKVQERTAELEARQQRLEHEIEERKKLESNFCRRKKWRRSGGWPPASPMISTIS